MLDQINPATIGNAPKRSVEGGIDLRRIMALFRRRIRLFMAVTILVFLAVTVMTLKATPSYTATATIMIDPRHEKIIDAEQVLSGLPADSSIVDTEVEVLKSRALAEKVALSLDLVHDPEFNSTLRQRSLLHKTIAQIGGATPTPSLDRQNQSVTDQVQEHLHIARSGLTYIITISFQSNSAAKSASIANTIAERYLALQLDTKFDATRRASDWLNSHLASLRDQVQQAETAVARYRASNGLMGLADVQGTTMTQQEISSLDTELATARVAEAEAVAKLTTAKGQLAHGSTGDDVGEALNSLVIQELRRQRSALSGQRADMEGRYGPKHPEMRKVERQLSDIDAEIQAEIHRIISNLEAQAQVAHGRTASIQASLAHARGDLVVSNGASVRLNELQRNADSVRILYQSFLDRFKQTSAEQGVEQSDARIVSRASEPTHPTTPRVALYLTLGLFLGIGFAGACLLLLEALEQGLYTADDVELALGLPLLGSIPALDSLLGARDRLTARLRRRDPAAYVVDHPLSAFAEAFRGLRTSLLMSGRGRATQVVALTSALPNEGKTTTSLSLGRIMAGSGLKTVLVDCDLRQRGLTRRLGLMPQQGLLEVLHGGISLDAALLKDGSTPLTLLPLSEAMAVSGDVFAGAAVGMLLEQLRARFDVILLDTAPMLPVADTRILAGRADCVLLLAEWRKTPCKAVQNAIRQLQMASVTLAGVVLTRVDMREQARSGYGDSGYYHAAYSNYYAAPATKQ